jgi:DNA-binding NarL/FixJ family response regulator
MKTVSVLIADDHQILRQGLRGLLERHPEFAVVAEAVNGREAVRLTIELTPDLVIIDIGMPDLNGIDATRQLLAECPATRVLGLSMHEDKRFITEMLRAGARGYLLKDCAFEELAQAIHTVLDGRIYLSPRINDLLLQDYVGALQRGGSAFTLLSPREREVLQLLAEGESVKSIAARLCISVKTVETYRQQIMDKVDIHSIAELTKYAIREGLTPLEG